MPATSLRNISGSSRAGRALRTSAFYLLNADTLVGWMFGAGIGFHMVSIINVSNGGSDVDVALHVYAHCPQDRCSHTCFAVASFRSLVAASCTCVVPTMDL
eukprot:COSAG04_NODE_1848_length_5409_cov_7.118644_10_plen_101_part_00